ncbi:MAG: thioredoxin family protein [Kiloniellales bacterium]
MTAQRKVEIFSGGCAVCDETIALIGALACPSCEVVVLDMKEAEVGKRARALGVRSVPAVAIDGKLADCCSRARPDEAVLQAAGLGQPLP